MSTDGPTVVTNVRAILREDQTGRPVFETAELRMAINRHVALVAKELGLGTSWDTSMVTLVTGTTDYTLPGASEYERVVALKYTSDGVPLDIVSLAEILAAREGATAQGRPYRCCLRPTDTQTVVLMTDSNPTEGEDIDGLISLVPDRWDASDATAPTIPFSEAAARVLELRVAESVVETAGAEKRNALAISDSAPAKWRKEADSLLHQEQLTIIRFKRARTPQWLARWARYGA